MKFVPFRYFVTLETPQKVELPNSRRGRRLATCPHCGARSSQSERYAQPGAPAVVPCGTCGEGMANVWKSSDPSALPPPGKKEEETPKNDEKHRMHQSGKVGFSLFDAASVVIPCIEESP